MAALFTTVARDLPADVTTVGVAGDLDLLSAATLRATMLKLIVECPLAVIADVTDCVLVHPACLAVFPALLRHQFGQPRVAILLGGVDDAFLAGGGRAALGNLPTYGSVAAAREAATATRPAEQRVTFTAPAHAGAPAAAREAIGVACDEWDLSPLRAQAVLIVSELVTNAYLHADSGVKVEAILRGSYLRLRVHDSSPTPPVPGQPLREFDPPRAHGRGLRLIERSCSGWGYQIRPDGQGKVVWANLRARPIGR